MCKCSCHDNHDTLSHMCWDSIDSTQVNVYDHTILQSDGYSLGETIELPFVPCFDISLVSAGIYPSTSWYNLYIHYTCYCMLFPPANAVILLLVALLYFYHVEEDKIIHGSMYPVYFLYIIVGLELLFALPCLIYYIGQPLGLLSGTCTVLFSVRDMYALAACTCVHLSNRHCHMYMYI